MQVQLFDTNRTLSNIAQRTKEGHGRESSDHGRHETALDNHTPHTPMHLHKSAPYFLVIHILAAHGLSPTLIAGRRCLLKVDRTSDQNPLILVGGTAQTIASWESHVPALSKNRPFMVYECIGQGTTPADLTDVSLPFQARQMDATISIAFPDHKQVDLVGFSLGARICMAYSVQFPSKVHKLHVTGVAVEPSKAGSVALESWNDMLKHGNLQGFGWSILQATYSPSFLHRNVNRLSQWVGFITDNNSAEGLLAILEQTRACEDWSALAMSKRMTRIRGCLAVGEQDLMAPYDQAQVLTGNLGWTDPTVMNGCGHAVPTEEPRLWRQHVLDFLDGPME
ncbi:hypothetical protein MHU86_117 [Fragilaria crotonensis]|nr:hypothetical protein MHU86_117 [Fragilaria crotonensis]